MLNTAGPVFDDYDRPVSAVLRRVRAAVRAGRTPSVVVQPTVYMDNLRAAWALPGIVAGGVVAYPLPPAVRASWVSHRTLAEAAVAAVTADVAGRVRGGEHALAVLAGAGTATLTLYCLHVVMRTEAVPPAEEPSSFVWHVLVVLWVGAALVVLGRRGPLEAGVSALARPLRGR